MPDSSVFAHIDSIQIETVHLQSWNIRGNRMQSDKSKLCSTIVNIIIAYQKKTSTNGHKNILLQ